MTIITRRRAVLVGVAAPALLLLRPSLVLPASSYHPINPLGKHCCPGSYDNTYWFPYSYNRPVYNRPAKVMAEWFGIRPANAAAHTLSWIGPAITGGPSSSNVAGPSTSSDISQSLTLSAASSTGISTSGANQTFVGLNIIGANTCVTVNHSGAKFLRCNFIASGTSGGSFPGTIYFGSGGTGALFEDCNISSNCTTNQQTPIFNTGALAAPALTVRRCTLSQGEKGIGVCHIQSTYIDSWFTNFVGGDCDMVQVYPSGAANNQTGPWTVQHNTFDGQNNAFSTFNNSCQNCSTWAVAPDQLGNNDIANGTFTNNACGLAASNTHQLLMDMRNSGGSFQSNFGIITNMTVTNNAFYGAAPYFGYHTGNSGAAGPTFTANSGNYIAAAWPPVPGAGSPINGTGAV